MTSTEVSTQIAIENTPCTPPHLVAQGKNFTQMYSIHTPPQGICTGETFDVYINRMNRRAQCKITEYETGLVATLEVVAKQCKLDPHSILLAIELFATIREHERNLPIEMRPGCSSKRGDMYSEVDMVADYLDIIACLSVAASVHNDDGMGIWHAIGVMITFSFIDRTDASDIFFRLKDRTWDVMAATGNNPLLTTPIDFFDAVSDARTLSDCSELDRLCNIICTLWGDTDTAHLNAYEKACIAARIFNRYSR